MLAPPLLLTNLGEGKAYMHVTVQLPKGEVRVDATAGYWFEELASGLRQVSK
jgi:hypothetical protein